MLVDGVDAGHRRARRPHAPRGARDRRRRPRHRRTRSPAPGALVSRASSPTPTAPTSSPTPTRRDRGRRGVVSAPVVRAKRFGPGAVATPANFVTIAPAAVRGPDADPHRASRARPGSRSRSGSCSRAPTGSTAGSPGATARRARVRSSTRSPTSSSCIGGLRRAGGPRRLLVVPGRARSRRARSASRSTASAAARRGISLPGAPAREVEGRPPVARGRRVRVPAGRGHGPS